MHLQLAAHWAREGGVLWQFWAEKCNSCGGNRTNQARIDRTVSLIGQIVTQFYSKNYNKALQRCVIRVSEMFADYRNSGIGGLCPIASTAQATVQPTIGLLPMPSFILRAVRQCACDPWCRSYHMKKDPQSY